MGVLRRRVRSTAVLRDRDQQPAPVRDAQRLAVRQDGINDFVVNGIARAVNPERAGTKVAAHQRPRARAGRERSGSDPADRHDRHRDPHGRPTGSGFDCVLSARQAEADTFYAAVIPETLNDDATTMMRQALAGRCGESSTTSATCTAGCTSTASHPWHPDAPAEPGPQPPVVPHARRRHRLDARQLGIRVVRRLGPGVPLRAPVAGGRRLRHGADRAAARHPIRAPFSYPSLAEVRLQESEIEDHGLAELDQALELMSGPLRRRVSRCAGTEPCAYLENGHPIPARTDRNSGGDRHRRRRRLRPERAELLLPSAHHSPRPLGYFVPGSGNLTDRL